MMKKIVSKIIASMLVLIMLLAYTATIGIYAKKVYATENTLEVQGVKTNNENVEFDAYFVNGKTKTHEIESKIGEGSSIYLSIAVKNAGYLKNTKVEFVGNEENSNANFLVKELTQANQAISAVNTTENYIELNQINKNEQANIQIPICFDNKDKISSFRNDRDNMYSELANNYSQIINNANSSNDIISQYQQKLSGLIEEKNQILMVENVIKSKGIEDVVIVITNNEKANVILKSDDLTEALAAQIMQVVVDQLNIKANNISIENIKT